MNTNTSYYLTKEKKELYMEDFQNLLNFEGNEKMKIESEIRQYLININKNELIQTLYSSFKTGDREKKTYLKLAYHKDIKLELREKIIPFFKNKFKVNDKKYCYKIFYRSEDNIVMYNDETGLKAYNDKDYYRINIIYIALRHFNEKAKIEFWNVLEEKLKNIN